MDVFLLKRQGESFVFQLLNCHLTAFMKLRRRQSVPANRAVLQLLSRVADDLQVSFVRIVHMSEDVTADDADYV